MIKYYDRTRYLGVNRFLEKMILKLRPDNELELVKDGGKDEECFRE